MAKDFYLLKPEIIIYEEIKIPLRFRIGSKEDEEAWKRHWEELEKEVEKQEIINQETIRQIEGGNKMKIYCSKCRTVISLLDDGVLWCTGCQESKITDECTLLEDSIKL